MFLSKNSPVVALDIGSYSIKVTRLKKGRTGYHLQNFGLMPLPPDTIVDNMIQEPEIVVESIKNLMKSEKIKEKNIVTGISGEAVVIKKISLPRMSEEELEESIKIEAEQYIPFDISDVNIDYQLIKNAGPGKAENREIDEDEEDNIEVLLVAAKKDIIEERVNVIRDAGLNPVVIDIDVFAIENCFELNYKDIDQDEVIALVDVGACTTNVNIIEKGLTEFTKDIPIGGIFLTQSIQNEFNISFEIAENLKYGIETEGFSSKDIFPIVIATAESIAQEVNKAFEFYSTAANKEISMVYMSGGGASIPDISDIFEKQFNIPVKANNPFRNITINNKIFDPDYIKEMKFFSAISVGLAIRRFYDR